MEQQSVGQPFSCTVVQEVNQLINASLSKRVYEAKFLSSSTSVSAVLPKIKFPYPNSFVFVDFWIGSFRSIC